MTHRRHHLGQPMSEDQLDLFNDTNHELGEAKTGDTLHIWYTNGRESTEPDLYCEVLSADGYGEIEFHVNNGAWGGVLYSGTDPVLKIYHTGKVIQVTKYKIIENQPKPKKSLDIDDFCDEDIAF